MESGGIPRYLVEPYTSDGGVDTSEISIGQFAAQSYRFEYLCPAIGTYGTDAHLAHDLEQTL